MLGTFGHARGVLEASGASRWQILIWSACSAIVGLLFIGAPIASAAMVMTLVAICWLLGGVVSAIAAVWQHADGWGWHFLGGVGAILAGLFVLGSPLFSAAVAADALFIVLGVSVLMIGGITLWVSRSFGAAMLGLALLIVGCMMLFAPFHVVPLVGLMQWIGLICLFGGLSTGVSAVVGRRPTTGD
jgi:hypothetical protein